MNVAQSFAKVSGSYGEYRDGQQKHLAVYFKKTDAGRCISKRPKQTNDCTVRAVALACNLPYDAAYELLAGSGRKCGRGVRFREVVKAMAIINGYRLTWIPFQAVKGESRMNPAKFCDRFVSGRWIVRTAKHVIAVIDGVFFDELSPRPGCCIYGAWRVEIR